ncbi:AAA family ATPase [Tessaracoccus flavus]|uniref:AAA family ATPase n=1 Tax=Tessaracoccus flavus TaxID=1610493 RepID=A0A1Q2CIX0_9ACTN|nr:AAA family ATPase [Tessaracoccus flavus]
MCQAGGVPVLTFDQSLPWRPQRVLVAGTSGSGKTTWASRIAHQLGVGHVEIDALYHGPNWTPRESFVEDVHALVGEEHWVTEWQYSSVRAVLASRADLMVWLDLPVATVMRQVTMRTLRRRLRREVLWNGNREPALWTVATEPDHIVRWAWKTRRRTAERIVALMNERPDLPVVRLTSHREARAWVAGPLAASSPGGMAYQREGA